MTPTRYLLALVSLSMLTGICGAQAITTYHIGNSLTHGITPDGVAAMAASTGIDHGVGYQVRYNSTLDDLWQNPGDSTATSVHGAFVNALANVAWDAIVLQPYPLDCDGNAVSDDELQRMRDIVDLARAGPSVDPTIYILMTWMCSTRRDDQAAWTSVDTTVPYRPTALNRQAFSWLRDSLQQAYGNDTRIYLVPVGDVFYELNIRFRDGRFPGFAGIEDLYVDRVHLTDDVGYWIAANVMYATLFARDPTGIDRPAGFFGDPASMALSRAQDEQLQSAIWDIVASHPDSGVAAAMVDAPPTEDPIEIAPPAESPADIPAPDPPAPTPAEPPPTETAADATAAGDPAAAQASTAATSSGESGGGSGSGLLTHIALAMLLLGRRRSSARTARAPRHARR